MYLIICKTPEAVWDDTQYAKTKGQDRDCPVIGDYQLLDFAEGGELNDKMELHKDRHPVAYLHKGYADLSDECTSICRGHLAQAGFVTLRR